MSYLKQLKEAVILTGDRAPLEIPEYNLSQSALTADMCNENHFMDYDIDNAYPRVVLLVRRDPDGKWRVKDGSVGIPEDGIRLGREEASAYVLQEMGVVEGVVEVRRGVEAGKERGMFVPQYDRSIGTDIVLRELEDNFKKGG